MLGIDQSDWQIEGSTLRKQYRYSGLVGEGSVHYIQIDIEKVTSSFGHTQYHIFFFIKPSLWPHLPDGFLAAQLALREGPADAPMATVRAGHADDGSLLLTPPSREHADAFLAVIYRGQPMRLLLLGEGTEKLAEIPIPNDAQFNEIAKTYFDREKDGASVEQGRKEAKYEDYTTRQTEGGLFEVSDRDGTALILVDVDEPKLVVHPDVEAFKVKLALPNGDRVNHAYSFKLKGLLLPFYLGIEQGKGMFLAPR